MVAREVHEEVELAALEGDPLRPRAYLAPHRVDRHPVEDEDVRVPTALLSAYPHLHTVCHVHRRAPRGVGPLPLGAVRVVIKRLHQRHRGPPNVRRHPRQEFAHAERLGDVVVGANLKANHAIDLRGPPADEDHRALDLEAQQSTGLESVDATREVCLHDHEIRSLRCSGVEGLDTRLRRTNLVPRVAH